MMACEKTLLRLFDYQKFEGNTRLAQLIAETNGRTSAENEAYALDDDELEVWAAGDLDAMKTDEHDFFIESDDDE